MPASYETEKDNAGAVFTAAPRPRGFLAALGLRRSKPIAPNAPGDGAMAAVPLAPYDVTADRPMVGPLMPLASANVQLGKFAVPYGAPTMVHALVSGPQLRCGVETIRRQYITVMAPGNPAPFFQQTMRPSFPVMTTRDGGRPGATLGPAGTAQTWGASRQDHAQALQDLATGLLGW